MQQAVLITAYKNIEHLYKITDSLSSCFKIYIHLDRKTAVSTDDLGRLKNKENVVLVSQKFNVNWGSIDHLYSILLLLEEALKDKANEYFHLITGHDYPIKSAEEISSFLERNKGKEFMEVVKVPYDKWENGGYDRILYYNLYDKFNARQGWRNTLVKRLIKLQKMFGIKRSFPKGFPADLYGGSTYWTLSRGFIDYVFSFMAQNPQVLKRFKYTFCSEEFFFQTLLMNSPFRDKVVPDNLRFIVWEERNGNFPANLDESDFDNIIKSNALFARKFEYPVSESLLAKLSQYLSSKTPTL